MEKKYLAPSNFLLTRGTDTENSRAIWKTSIFWIINKSDQKKDFFFRKSGPESTLNILWTVEVRISSDVKKKPVAWLVSNCHSHSQRENYVSELSKYINGVWLIIKIYDEI